MFTGLIREIGEVKSYKNNVLSIQSKHKASLGDSIAVNGVCLTVISLQNDGFSVELADETRSIIDSSRLKGKVHIEPAMMLHDRFEGHIVQGHVDVVGVVEQINRLENGVDFIIKVPNQHIRHIVPKGSIAIDGVSLTVNEVFENSFRLTIISHTLHETLIGHYEIGTQVNIETDMFARYIDHLLHHKKPISASMPIGWEEIDDISMRY
ncbi:MAG: riboflavin synthase [Epsilonproteobacteria bacterium]|nr:riboflavin synthase [Campylobacterota bacterium]MBD3839521.1 riboflavin synthase [Campylobacterota bacterium]